MQNINNGGPLIKESKAGNRESGRRLLTLKRIIPDKADENARTPLAWAALAGHDPSCAGTTGTWRCES